VAQPEELVPLDEAAMLIAAQGRPSVGVAAGLAALDAIAAGCPGPRFDDWHRHLFGELKFRGNAADYYDPANSWLDQVLARRVGIPITLTVIAVEVARRVGVEAWPVAMPGHVLVGHPTGWVDPFHGGVRLDEAGCRQRFEALVGSAVTFHERFLARAGAHTMLARMLANLRAIHTARRDDVALSGVLELLVAIPGATRADREALAAARARAAARLN
jgi:regulator of sirC expression with transglutaminase-like and TPR domain